MSTHPPKRTVVLMAVLLALLLGYLAWQGWTSWQAHRFPAAVAGQEAPLPGKNTVSNLRVTRDVQGRWIASFDYFYTGAPPRALLNAAATGGSVLMIGGPGGMSGFSQQAQRGQQHFSGELLRPPHPQQPLRSETIVAQIWAPQGALARLQIEQAIDWPDWQTWTIDHEVASQLPATVLAKAIGLIDQGQRDSLYQARLLLERLVARDPQFESAYIELARVAMKTKPWPDGLRQAQSLLASALQIRPDSVNAQILMGYVQTHQGQYKRAQELFSAAASAGSSNLWLWANWGELLSMQGQFPAAIDKYRQVLSHPPKGDANDRARLDAYERLLGLLQQRRDIDGMQALYKQRYEEQGASSCYGVAYGRFLLQERGDAASAAALARQAVEPRCAETVAKEVLGMARYVEWSQSRAADRNTLLHQARVFLPMGPTVLYQLAAGDRTVDAVRQLQAAGEAVDQLDNRKFNALAYALEGRDHAAARRLLRLGAKPDSEIDDTRMPVALLPVLAGDVEGLRLMQQFGVDYTKLRFEGVTAIEHARRIGDRRVLQALKPKSSSL